MRCDNNCYSYIQEELLNSSWLYFIMWSITTKLWRFNNTDTISDNENMIIFIMITSQRSKDVINLTKAALEADKKSFGELFPLPSSLWHSSYDLHCSILFSFLPLHSLFHNLHIFVIFLSLFQFFFLSSSAIFSLCFFSSHFFFTMSIYHIIGSSLLSISKASTMAHMRPLRAADFEYALARTRKAGTQKYQNILLKLCFLWRGYWLMRWDARWR